MKHDSAKRRGSSSDSSGRDAGGFMDCLDSEASDRQIIAYAVTDHPPPIRRALRERTWMDETPQRFAYHCLPLVIGNQAGWDILNTLPFRARWNGGDQPADVQVEPLEEPTAGATWLLATAHFGVGILTFSVGYLFRTPPGIGLLVCGPPNAPKDGLFALTGIVETDWIEATFTMNYRFTRRGHWVQFDRDEPVCRIIPIDRHLVERLPGEIRLIEEDAELEARFNHWKTGRLSFNENLKNPFSAAARQGWQRDYFLGVNACGERMPHHQTQLHHRNFVDRRPGTPQPPPATPKRRLIPQRSQRRETAAQHLWDNLQIFDQRREGCAVVAAGIARLLRDKPLTNDGAYTYLETFDRLRRLPPVETNLIWREPLIFHWVRVAFQLVDHLVNGSPLGTLTTRYLDQIGISEPSAAVSMHLDAFRLFELGVAVAGNGDLRWSKPLTVRCPCAIPGTPWSLEGSGTVTLAGYVSQQLLLHADRQSVPVPLHPGRIADSDVVIRQCEIAGCEQVRLRIQPEVMAGLGLEEASPAIASSPDFRKRTVPVIEQALRHIRDLDTRSFRALADECRVIAPKSAAAGGYSNTTFSSLPGAMVLTVVPHPLEMADRIIHEVHHDRLFCIEELNPLLADIPDDGHCYSPWRDDPRPVRGLLHGLYVFVAVGRFWLRALTADSTSHADRIYAAERLRRIIGQLQAAVTVLEDHARLTPFGTGLFDQLRLDVADLGRDIDTAGVPADVQALWVTNEGDVIPEVSVVNGQPLTVGQALREHRERFDPANETGPKGGIPYDRTHSFDSGT